ncbi:MAG: S24 family peptidase [Clostridia bacterium]|nr:S24 family peptidase [Clostridia bacterium]
MSIQSERILEILKKNEVSYGELSKLTGIPKSALQRYATGETTKIPIDRLESIAKVLNTTPAYIMGWEDEAHPLPGNAIPLSEMDFVNIPIIGRVAAGVACFAESNIIGYQPVESKYIQNGEEYAFLRVVGDSMYPKLEDGDLVLVRCQASVDNGAFAVVNIDNEDGVVKKIIYGDDFIELVSINPMYPPRRFEGEDVLRIRVFGLVKQIVRKL